MGKLSNKVAVVTGGAKGLGQAIAEAFANEGATVIACDMGELTYSHENVVGYHLNVTDVQGIQKFFDEVVAKYGKIDILVNNAGITKDAMTRKMTDDQWNAVIDVNLKGVFNMTRLIGPLMETNGYG
ncbi:MAG: SDR family NAD(P)-dependent oxidoreductase, partial [Acholeplasmataceae bacterium]|nr:SDR family NAD(P)-dependent oxidoreductase [Acholeplasmataceae bacterium]